MTCLIFTATLNEFDNMSTLVGDCLAQLPDAHMLVVDDNSADGTGQLLDQLVTQYPGQLHVIHRPRKLGLGSAHKLAIKFAAQGNYDTLITMDADYSHHPKYLPTMIKALETSEFVTGSRYVDGGKCDYGLGRQMISRCANFLARSLLGIKLHETTTSYRGFRRSLLLRLPVDKIKAEGYAFFFESIFHACRIAEHSSEFPIYFEDRRAGTSKISKKEIALAAVRLFRLTVRRILQKFENFLPTASAHKNAEPCDVCGTTFHVELYAANSPLHDSAMYNCTSAHHDLHGRIVKCLVCGLVATNPKMSPENLATLYSDVVDQTYIANIPARIKTFEYNFKKITRFLPKTGKLLDVGSYYGIFLQYAQKSGFDVAGIEPSIAASSYARDTLGLKVHSGTLADFPNPAKRFDIITSWDVMEHFFSPMAELSKISAQIETGGTFAFSTLNWDNWYARLMGEKWPWMMDMHLYYFDDKIIEEMLRRNGFKLTWADTYCHIITLDYFLMKLDSLGVPFAVPLRKLLARTPLSDLNIPFKFGDIRYYVAVKI